MKRQVDLNRCVFAGVLLGMFLIMGPSPRSAVAQEFQEHTVERTISTTLSYQCVISLPEGYEDDLEKAWPMIFYLHGGGSKNAKRLKQMIQPFTKLPAIVIAPMNPPSDKGPLLNNWNWEMLGEVVRELDGKYRIDPERRSVVGFSMGGSGAWELPFRQAGLFSKSVVIAGVCHPWALRHYPKIPVWVFIGSKDYMRKEQEETVTSARRFKVDVLATVWKGADHGGIFNRAKAYQPMLDWLVSDEDLRVGGELE